MNIDKKRKPSGTLLEDFELKRRSSLSALPEFTMSSVTPTDNTPIVNTTPGGDLIQSENCLFTAATDVVCPTQNVTTTEQIQGSTIQGYYTAQPVVHSNLSGVILGALQEPSFVQKLAPTLVFMLSSTIQEAITSAVQTATSNLEQKVIMPLQASIEKNDEENKKLRDLIKQKENQIESMTKQIEDLSQNVDDLEQYGRRNSLRLTNMRLHQNGYTDDKLATFITDNIKVKVTPDDFERHQTTSKDRTHLVRRETVNAKS